jgi:hypothetical protein
MRRFRVIDGSNNGSLEVLRTSALAPVPADAPPAAPQHSSESPAAQRSHGADEPDSVDGLITASTSYHAALQTTAHIRQRSLLDFLR